jgi:hypothetical protein
MIYIKARSPAFSFCFHETSIAVSEIKKRRGGSNVFYYRFGFQTFSFHVHMTYSLLLKMMVMLCLGFELIDHFCFDEIWLWMTFFLGSSCFVLHALSKFYEIHVMVCHFNCVYCDAPVLIIIKMFFFMRCIRPVP